MHNRRPPLRKAFNFAEVLFAVMILGIGFIMIAAIFPVALLQTKSTMEETAAASVSRGGIGYVQASATGGNIKDTGGKVVRVAKMNPPNPLWDAIKGNIVLPSDPRYGAAVFYKRDAGAAFAQVIVIPIFSRNQGNFEKVTRKDPADATRTPIDEAFVPKTVTLAVNNNRATITGPALDVAAAVEGAYLVVADAGTVTRLNGRILRLAGEVSPGVWDLMPGWDFVRDPGNDEKYEKPGSPPQDDILSFAAASAFIIGRGRADPSAKPAAAGETVQGVAQDIAAYTTFVLIK